MKKILIISTRSTLIDGGLCYFVTIVEETQPHKTLTRFYNMILLP